jgi:uncharacterized protein YkwD
MNRGVKQLFAAFSVGLSLALMVPSHQLSTAMPLNASQPITSFPVAVGLPDPNAVFDAVNQTRVTNGLPSLQKDATLSRIAQQRAMDMQQNSYYAHKSPDGKFYYDLLYEQQIGFNYSCENLDLQFTTTPNDYVSDWMNSNKGHRECLLNDSINRAGYAVALVNTGSYTANNVPTYIIVAIHTSN